MILYLSTVEPYQTTIGLAKAGRVLSLQHFQQTNRRTDNLLSLVAEVLQNRKLKPQNLAGVVVVRGPGRFTAVRLGVILANTFAWALKIPLVGVKADTERNHQKLLSKGLKSLKANQKYKPVEPFYDQPPNITKSRKPFK